MHILKIPVKQLQHVNVTKRNIFGRNMLRAFDRPVAPCCDMLSVVGSNLTIFKFEPTTQGGQTRATIMTRRTEKKT